MVALEKWPLLLERVCNTVGAIWYSLYINRLYGLIPLASRQVYSFSRRRLPFEIPLQLWPCIFSRWWNWMGYTAEPVVQVSFCEWNGLPRLSREHIVLFSPGAVYLPLPFPIMLWYVFHYFPPPVLFGSDGERRWASLARCHNQHFPSRDDGRGGPLYRGRSVDYHRFLFTGRSRL